MRTTLHLVPANKYHIVSGLYNYDGCKAVDDRLAKFGMSSAEFEYISTQILKIFQSKGPMLTQTLTSCLKEQEKSSTKYKVRNLSMQAGKTTVTQSNVSIILHALVGQARVQYGLASPPPAPPAPAPPPAAAAGGGGNAPHTYTHSSQHPTPLPLESWRDTRRLHGIASLATDKVSSEESSQDNYTKDRTETQEQSGVTSAIATATTSTTQETLLTDLMRWYFELYSPASLQDFIWWSGRKVRESRAALTVLLSQQELRPINVLGLSCECYVWSEHEEALLASEDSLPRGVRFLPYEDALIKAYKETRHRFYFLKPEEGGDEEEVVANESLYDLIFLKTASIPTWKGEAHPSLWVDGQIVGRWKWENRKKTPTTKSKRSNQTAKGEKEEEGGKSSEDSPAVVSIITRQQLTKKLQARLSEELVVLCEMLHCCPSDDVEYVIQQQ
jgi:hypothetical protein